MKWHFNNDSPIYQQIKTEIINMIVRGEISSGQQVPSVRDLAANAKVNPNTMQRALHELETEGVLKSDRTRGRFVSLEENQIKEFRKNVVDEIAQEISSRIRNLQLSEDELNNVFETIRRNYDTK